MLKCKKGLFKESMEIENAIERLRAGFSHEQLAKFLILMEQFKTREQFSVFNLWNIKKTNKNEIVSKSISFQQGISQKSSPSKVPVSADVSSDEEESEDSMEQEYIEDEDKKLYPSVQDPKLWRVRVKKGFERTAAMALMNK